MEAHTISLSSRSTSCTSGSMPLSVITAALVTSSVPRVMALMAMVALSCTSGSGNRTRSTSERIAPSSTTRVLLEPCPPRASPAMASAAYRCISVSGKRLRNIKGLTAPSCTSRSLWPDAQRLHSASAEYRWHATSRLFARLSSAGRAFSDNISVRISSVCVRLAKVRAASLCTRTSSLKPRSTTTFTTPSRTRSVCSSCESDMLAMAKAASLCTARSG
mmetsp:Transcript_13046/g.28966  ORF Transcript_13046/g.28966 Transcript_13046/m.28966 type:complete len:219 (-) Transcript_13046:6699-7355(-)